MISVACAAVLMFGIENHFDTIPPLVKGELVNEKVIDGKDVFGVKFTDLKGKKRVEMFEANTCKFIKEGK